MSDGLPGFGGGKSPVLGPSQTPPPFISPMAGPNVIPQSIAAPPALDPSFLQALAQNPEAMAIIGQMGQGLLQGSRQTVDLGGGFRARAGSGAAFSGGIAAGGQEAMRQAMMAGSLKAELEKEERTDERQRKRDDRLFGQRKELSEATFSRSRLTSERMALTSNRKDLLKRQEEAVELGVPISQESDLSGDSFFDDNELPFSEAIPVEDLRFEIAKFKHEGEVAQKNTDFSKAMSDRREKDRKELITETDKVAANAKVMAKNLAAKQESINKRVQASTVKAAENRIEIPPEIIEAGPDAMERHIAQVIGERGKEPTADQLIQAEEALLTHLAEHGFTDEAGRPIDKVTSDQTRRIKEVLKDHPDWTFQEIAEFLTPEAEEKAPTKLPSKPSRKNAIFGE